MRQAESSTDTVQQQKNSCLQDAFVFFLWHKSRHAWSITDTDLVLCTLEDRAIARLWYMIHCHSISMRVTAVRTAAQTLAYWKISQSLLTFPPNIFHEKLTHQIPTRNTASVLPQKSHQPFTKYFSWETPPKKKYSPRRPSDISHQKIPRDSPLQKIPLIN